MKDAFLPVVRVTPDFHRRFKALAEAEHRTMSAEIRRLAERRLAEYEAEHLEEAA